ncbi:hypothetical protein [Clostridium estertheticum]|uniref:hypothetical protein n=1 Tax=Clostridium estertheticum TaxID=238834 RepID=UPI001CF4ED81|nr:hypothetical protein [Clostridium estertheticum]MCB2342431.1 hypothetical protein [Clostridium estertheticum]
MRIKKISVYVTAITTLIIILFTIYKGFSGKEVGFSEITSIAISMAMFFSAITWGNEEDGIVEKEELGQKIIGESSKIAYWVLFTFIFIEAVVYKVITGIYNIPAVILLSLALVTLPLIQFIISKKYQ